MFFVQETITRLTTEYALISEARKIILRNVASFITNRISNRQQANLVFICTHNSLRSHISQIWAQTAASYFNIANVNTFSGGTETTAFNPLAVNALIATGFRIYATTHGNNPRYMVRYSDRHPEFEVFSKKYDEPQNPSKDFAAIMTCTHADENCPVVTGALVRISLPYEDPKDFDGTDLESDKYKERSLEIGREILFAFSQIKTK